MDSENTYIILDRINIASLLKASNAFQAALNAPKNDLTRDATIQRFEFTFELAWKTLKRVLKVQGILVNNPRDTFRSAAQNALIPDPTLWFEFLDYRNQTTHIYNEKIAETIYAALTQFDQQLILLLNHLKSL